MLAALDFCLPPAAGGLLGVLPAGDLGLSTSASPAVYAVLCAVLCAMWCAVGWCCALEAGALLCCTACW
jgi:hypothetical protein